MTAALRTRIFWLPKNYPILMTNPGYFECSIKVCIMSPFKETVKFQPLTEATPFLKRKMFTKIRYRRPVSLIGPLV